MNSLQVFNFKNREVRTAMVNSEPWFVAKDVCEVLELQDVTSSLRQLDYDEKLLRKVSESGQNRDITIINESGLYSLVLTSNKPEAKEFRRWVTHEVIPSIRKTGFYSTKQDSYVIQNPAERARRWAEEYEEKQLLEEKVQTLLPKAEYFDALVDSHLLLNIQDTAKELHQKQNAFVTWLLEKKYVYRDAKGNLKPKSQYTPSLFELKEFTNSWDGYSDTRLLITPKGRETFRLLLEKGR